MFDILLDYSFLTVAIGTSLLAVSSSMIGTISVLTKQSLIGDMLGHASYPGVVFAFILFQTREPVILMLGAMFSGYVSYGLVYWVARHYRQSLVNALALVSAAFLGLGMVLKQLVQDSSHFANSSQAGLQTYLFGQAAFIKQDDVLLISFVSILCLVLFFLFYARFKVYLFDEVFARVIGVPNQLLRYLIRLMMISLIAVGLKVVGAVLMSAFLIAPATFGLLWGKGYGQVLTLASGLGLVSALLGTYISSVVSGLSTGPAIILCMSSVAFISYIYLTYIKKEVPDV